MLKGVRYLTVLGEAGTWAAAYQCAERWQNAGRFARIAKPDNGLGDMNDVLRERAGWYVSARFLP